MNSIRVQSSRGNYSIYVGRGLLQKAGDLWVSLQLGKALIVTQKQAAKFHLKPLEDSLKKNKIASRVHFIPSGETAKSKENLWGIYQRLAREGFERRDAVLALGGGVVGDVAGFAAASYLRGIPFINIGTTLLAQVDSSIGGKTGINLDQGKNLVGAFYPPRLVISDPQVLTTLPARELRASLAEVVKYGILRDPKLFRLLEKSGQSILQKDIRLLEAMILASARIKAAVVSEDEFEIKGTRMILNLGHTFGHGFEQASGYRKLLHGEAVSIGIVCAARLASSIGIFSRLETERIIGVLQKLQTPVSLNGLHLQTGRILIAMSRDKKKSAGKIRFVLPVEIGKVVVRDDVPPRLVRKIIQEAGGR